MNYPVRPILCCLIILISACSPSVSPPAVVPALDAGRYAGCWYEIATIPMYVQRGCVGTTAVYQARSGNTLKVTNRCYSESLEGSVRQVEGEATVTDLKEPAKLRVAFDTWWGVFAKGDYWVIMLDPEYRYSVVSGPSRERLWILSRTPVLEESTLGSIRRTLLERGFDLSGLEMTRQFPEKNLCAQQG